MTEEEVQAISRGGPGKRFDRLLVEIFLGRSIPSFHQHAGLDKFDLTVGDCSIPVKERKAVGA